jgi:hypothetical protein
MAERRRVKGERRRWPLDSLVLLMVVKRVKG